MLNFICNQKALQVISVMINYIFCIIILCIILIPFCVLIFKYNKTSKLFDLFINNSNEIMWKIDDKYIIKYVNNADKKLRGFEKKEVIGKSIKQHLSEDSIYMIDMLREIRLDEESRNIFPKSRTIEIDLICKNSKPVTVETIITYDYQNNSLKGFYGTARDITIRKQNEADLYFQANNDALTKLYNRRSFMDIAKREFELAKRHSKPLSVLMLDIDKFKKINDTYGHHAGDVVLQNVAEFGSKILRSTDVFGRLGGEEFCILATETDLEGAIKLAEKLKSFYENHTVTVDKSKIKFTVSIGVTSLEIGDKDFNDMLKRADKYLYIAKNTGRNRVVFYSDAKS